MKTKRTRIKVSSLIEATVIAQKVTLPTTLVKKNDVVTKVVAYNKYGFNNITK